MILIIGGYAQGKLDYAMRTYQLTEQEILDGEVAGTEAEILCIDHFNSWARRQFEAGAAAWDQVLAIDHQQKEKGGKLIILSTEIGNGIVPIDAGDRAFREWMGRMQVRLAAEAEAVIRICCGIPQRLK